MIHIAKREQETSSSLVRRFLQRVQSSGLLKEAKTKRFYQRPMSRNLRRAAALERNGMRQEFKRLWKLGRIKRDEE